MQSKHGTVLATTYTDEQTLPADDIASVKEEPQAIRLTVMGTAGAAADKEDGANGNFTTCGKLERP